MRHHLLSAVCLGVLSSTLLAQTGPELISDPMYKTTGEASLFVGAMRNASTDSPGNHVNLWRTEGDFRLKLDPLMSRDAATTQSGAQGFVFENVRVGYEHTWLHLDTLHPALPDNLQDQSLGASFTFYRDADWRISFGAAVGYAGNNPYADANATYAKADVMAERKLDDKSSLMLSLNYNGNRTFMPDVPLPGIAYVRRSSDTLWYMVGIPVSIIEWKPVEKLTLRASYLLVDNFTLGARYDLTKQLALLVDYRSKSDAFQVHDEGHDRLYFQQQTIEGAIQYSPIENLTLTAAVGFAFAQEFSTGYDTRDTDKITDVSDEPYVRLGASFRF